MKKKLLISFVLSIIVTFGVILFRVYWADPLHFYSLDTSKARYSSNMRVQAAGLINNLDFDSVILGNSHMENTSCKEASEVFGGKFINVSLSGSNLYERAVLLERILAKGDIKTVYLLLGARLDKTGHGKYAIDNWDYLYDENRFNDILYYFNSHDLICIFTFSKQSSCIGSRKDLDKPNAWSEIPAHNSRFGGIRNWIKYYNNNQLRPILTEAIPLAAAKSRNELTDGVDFKTVEQIDITIEETLVTFAKRYPDTNFYAFFNPESLLLHAVEKTSGKFDFYKAFVKEVVRLLTPYSNFKIYGFDNLEFTDDLAFYKDWSHYKPEINSLLLRHIGKDQYRLTGSNVDEYLNILTKRVDSYDLVSLNEVIQRGIQELKNK